MKFVRLGYLLAFVFPLIAILGYVFQQPWLFLAIAAGWVVLGQILDGVAGHDARVPWRVVRASIAAADARFPTENVILYVYVLAHLVAVALGVWEFRRTDDVLPWILYAFPVGLSGGNALNVSHELLHGSTRLDRWIGRAASTPAFWTVQEYEHLFLHHRGEFFCTESDAAAARLGQSFYAYFVKKVAANYRHAWELQGRVLTASGKKLVGARMLASIYLPPVVIAVVIAILFGWWALFFFLLQAYLSVSLFLLGTYNQHYGLIRRVGTDGRLEPYSYMNIWSADQRLTDLSMWAIGRHAHHHLDPFCSYSELKVIEGSPLLPYGYFTSIVLALVPPLWFKVMDPRVADVLGRRDQLQAQGLL